jgi:hypothetical protein
MKTKLCVIAAVLAFCCALVVGSATRARAEEPCTTQGALALALADVLGIKVTTAQEAADALAALGVKPLLGWDVEACLSDAVSLEISQTFASLNRDAGAFERAMGMIAPRTDRVYPPVSPSRP